MRSCLLFLLSVSPPLGQSFLALSPSRQHILAARPLPSSMLMSSRGGRDDEPHEPILLPPADYSKPGSVVNLVRMAAASDLFADRFPVASSQRARLI